MAIEERLCGHGVPIEHCPAKAPEPTGDDKVTHKAILLEDRGSAGCICGFGKTGMPQRWHQVDEHIRRATEPKAPDVIEVELPTTELYAERIIEYQEILKAEIAAKNELRDRLGLLAYQRRIRAEKAEKERDAALELLGAYRSDAARFEIEMAKVKSERDVALTELQELRKTGLPYEGGR